MVKGEEVTALHNNEDWTTREVSTLNGLGGLVSDLDPKCFVLEGRWELEELRSMLLGNRCFTVEYSSLDNLGFFLSYSAVVQFLSRKACCL
jgi:hypothetical protein